MNQFRIMFHFTVGMPNLEHDFRSPNDESAIRDASRMIRNLDSKVLMNATLWAAGDENTEPRLVARLTPVSEVRVETLADLMK